MTQRAELPAAAVTITPGYSWRLDLDVLFDGERPSDWSDWTVRMHVWAYGTQFTLINGDGVTFEEVDDLPGAEAPWTIPVIQMTAAQTAGLKDASPIHYLIDLKAPDGDVEDYFGGSFAKEIGPPLEMLQ